MSNSQVVVLFVYRRPELTRKVLEAVVSYSPRKLYVFADGLRDAKDANPIQETRGLFAGSSWGFQTEVISSSENLGLRESVLRGLDYVFEREESAIILEDDCLPAADFWEFCNWASKSNLIEKGIGAVSGNNFVNLGPMDKPRVVEIPRIWGWMTSRRIWVEFRRSNVELDRARYLTKKNLAPKHLAKLIKRDLLSGNVKVDSWALDFAVFMVANSWATLIPPRNLVTNIGFGADATHTKFESPLDFVKPYTIRFPLVTPTGKLDKFHVWLEGAQRLPKWALFAIAHPFDFVSRVYRYWVGQNPALDFSSLRKPRFFRYPKQND